MEPEQLDPRGALGIGRRIICEEHFGTIKYVGTVPPTEGVWLGVEWDKPSRGKHNGTHDGVKYFTCHVEGSGSFLRPKKADLGTTFVEAVKERYVEGGVAEEEELYVDVKPVVMVGCDKVTKAQSRIDELVEVSVRGMLVSSAGPSSEIACTTPRISLLDLSQNQLLSSWSTVSDIASQLSLLASLDLSENSQLPMPTNPLLHTKSFSTLKSLYLNKMGLSWDKLSVVLKMVPGLEILHACENAIEDIRNEADIPKNLSLLNLEENLLSDWEAVLRLKSLTKLKTLILNDNRLSSLSFDGNPEQFPALECLCLSGNKITQWQSVDSLAALPALRDLRLKGNPLNKDESVFTMRQLLIARLECLQALNNSAITIKERQLAERYYLKRYISDFTTSESTSEAALSQFHHSHPRYATLLSIHGVPTEVKVIQGGTTAAALKEGLIRVNFRCPEDPSQKELSRKLPTTMTVQKLKGLLQRLYKVNTSIQRLSYQSKEGSHEIELADNLRQLSFYSVSDGDSVLVRW